MSGGFISKKELTLAVSSSLRMTFSNGDSPWASFQVIRPLGTQDASFKVWSSNVSTADIPGSGIGQSNPLSGSNTFYSYWTLEVGASGTCFTGSVTDAASPFTLHLADIGTMHLMVELSSSSGGKFTVYPHTKGS